MSQPASEPSNEPSNWNVPNALTTLRIAMVPFFGWALLIHDGQSDGWRWVAWLLFIIAMITDKVDGDIARKHNLITNFGKIADPIADKTITGMAFIGLAIVAPPPIPAWLWWTITVIVLVREWSVTIARLSIARQVVMPARQSGKVKTTAQAVALSMFCAPLELLDGSWETVGTVGGWVAAAFMAVAVVLTLSSGVEFVRDVLAHRRTREVNPAS